RTTLYGAVKAAGSPYADSPWRDDKGGLWDLGPHALASIVPVLGPVVEVAAMTAPAKTHHVLARHAGGAVSTLHLSIHQTPAATVWETVLFGPAGAATLPTLTTELVDAFRAAVAPPFALGTHVRHVEGRLEDLVVVAPLALAVPAQHLQLVLHVRGVEQVARVGVLRDQPQGLLLPAATDHDRRVRRAQRRRRVQRPGELVVPPLERRFVAAAHLLVDPPRLLQPLEARGDRRERY